MARRWMILLGLVFTPLMFSSSGWAESEEVKFRQNYMKAVGGNMGAIGGIMKTKKDLPDQVLAHAQSMEQIAPHILNAFGKGSEGGDAKADIWKKWPDFKMKADAFIKAAKGLGDAARSKNMGKVGAAMGKLGKTCKGCHKPYKD